MSAPIVTVRHAPCGLAHHAPGKRVRWQVWDRDTSRWVWQHGVVVAHANRTLVVDTGGVRVAMSCGPVMAEVGK